jgi:hypothetical protein
VNHTPKSILVLFVSVIFTVLFTSLSCPKQDYNPELVKYLRAEKELRNRITEEQGLSDSLKRLQKKYNIDLDKELKTLSKNPEAWVKILKELKIEK